MSPRHSIVPFTSSCLVALVATACSNGGGGAAPPTLEASSDPLAAASTVPEVVLKGGNGTARFWTDAVGGVRIAQLTTEADPAQDVFVTFEQGELRRIDDAKSGAFALIEPRSADRVDLEEYDANGDYVRGTAVTRTASGYELAEVRGTAAFDGQVAGQLTLPSQTGSYALVSKLTSELGVPAALDAPQAALVEALASEIVPPGTAPLLANPSTAEALRWAAVLARADAGDTAGPVFGTAAPVFGTAGVAMVLAGFGGVSIVDAVRDRFAVADPLAQELVDLALDFVADPSAPGAVAFWRNARAQFGDGQPFSDAQLDALKASFAIGASPPQGVASITAPANPLQPISGPPVITVDLEGQAVWQDGAFYPLGGTIDAQGRIDAAGMLGGNDPNDMLTVVANVDANMVMGACDRAGTAGTVDGSTAPIGACNVATQSGGQGTFSFAQFIGPGAGTVTFDYQAFSIPDQFIVRTAQGVKFDTGGLVSGGQSISIPIDGEPIVFVSVRAPRSGTAWNYTLSCLN